MQNVVDVYQRCASTRNRSIGCGVCGIFSATSSISEMTIGSRKSCEPPTRSCGVAIAHFSSCQELRDRRLPAPLPYIEPTFSPSALRRDQRQVLDRKEQDFLLVKKAFAELPVPLIKFRLRRFTTPGLSCSSGMRSVISWSHCLRMTSTVHSPKRSGDPSRLPAAARQIRRPGLPGRTKCRRSILRADDGTFGGMGDDAIRGRHAQEEVIKPKTARLSASLRPPAADACSGQDACKCQLEQFALTPVESQELQHDLQLSQSVADAILALPKIGNLPPDCRSRRRPIPGPSRNASSDCRARELISYRHRE